MEYGKTMSGSKGTAVPVFQIENGNDILRDKRSQYNYQAYQKQYRKARGVMPELDKINNPVLAVCADYVLLPEDIRDAKKLSDKNKRGNMLGGAIDGALTGSWLAAGVIGLASGLDGGSGGHLVPLIASRFEKLLEKYKYAYSLISNYDYDSIDSIPSGSSNIVDNLGYKKENGRYYEGTWQNGRIVYGMLFLQDANTIFIGSFDADGLIEEGVRFQDQNEYHLGIFNDECELNCNNGAEIMHNVSKSSRGTLNGIYIGGFEKGRRNGKGLQFVVDDSGVYASEKEYDFGEELKKSITAKTGGIAKTTARGFLRYIEICALVGGIIGILGAFINPSSLIGSLFSLAVWFFLNHRRKNPK